MTRRSSTRALAREIYCQMAQATQTTTPTPDPSPQEGGEKLGVGGGEKDDLTARVRALYEDSAVPVREIARIAGVTERTIYKYVIKQDWKRRYRVKPRGLAAAAANRGRRWQPAPDFAPAKGTGGRFIHRADKGKPFATGLKATDAAGRARALAESAAAERRADVAQAEAEAERANDGLCRAIALMHGATRQFVEYGTARQPQGARSNSRTEDRLEDLFVRACDLSRSHVACTLGEWKRAEERARAAKAELDRSQPKRAATRCN